MSELLPCPFCGGEADIYAISENIMNVRCTNCYGETCSYFKAKDAIEAWNTRAERTCKIEGGYYDEVMECFYTQLSCGHEVDKNERDFDYCLYCGAKVVSE